MKKEGDKVKYIGGCDQVREHFGNRQWRNAEKTLIPGKEYEVITVWCMQNEDWEYNVILSEEGLEIAVAAKYFENDTK